MQTLKFMQNLSICSVWTNENIRLISVEVFILLPLFVQDPEHSIPLQAHEEYNTVNYVQLAMEEGVDLSNINSHLNILVANPNEEGVPNIDNENPEYTCNPSTEEIVPITTEEATEDDQSSDYSYHTLTYDSEYVSEEEDIEGESMPDWDSPTDINDNNEMNTSAYAQSK